MNASAVQIALFVYGITAVIAFFVAVLVRVLYLAVRSLGRRKERP